MGCHRLLGCADDAADIVPTINLCEPMAHEDATLLGRDYGTNQIATTSSVFCPRFVADVQYEATLTEQYLKGKAIRAAKQSNPLSAAPSDNTDDEPATPATWRSSVFLEPPLRSELTCYLEDLGMVRGRSVNGWTRRPRGLPSRRVRSGISSNLGVRRRTSVGTGGGNAGSISPHLQTSYHSHGVWRAHHLPQKQQRRQQMKSYQETNFDVRFAFY